jgi:hypothetical protein
LRDRPASSERLDKGAGHREGDLASLRLLQTENERSTQPVALPPLRQTPPVLQKADRHSTPPTLTQNETKPVHKCASHAHLTE